MSYKIVIAGPAASGKTSLMHYIQDEEIPVQYTPTIGCQIINMKIDVDNISTRLTIWDTAGDSRFKGLCKGYFINASAFIIFLAAGDPAEESFVNHYNKVREVSSAPVYVLVNKSDLGVPDIGALANHLCIDDEKHIEGLYTCSLTDEVDQGIANLFEHMVRALRT